MVLLNRRFRTWLIALALALSVTACSMIRVGYSMAPTLINWELSRYVTFDPVQQALVDEHLKMLHEWHRQTQVPAYVAFLDRVDDRLAAGAPFPVAGLVKFRQQMQQAWGPLVDRLSEPIAQVLVTLTTEQVAKIEAEMARKNLEMRGKYQLQDPLKRRQAREQRWQDRMIYFLGELTQLQQATLSRGVAKMTDSGPWWERRQARQQKSLATLREIVGQEMPVNQATRRVRQWLTSFGNSDDPQAQQLSEQMIAESDALVSSILELATPEQVAHARILFAGFAADLRTVAQMPGNRKRTSHQLNRPVIEVAVIVDQITWMGRELTTKLPVSWQVPTRQ